jgi:hypothetical protein
MGNTGSLIIQTAVAIYFAIYNYFFAHHSRYCPDIDETLLESSYRFALAVVAPDNSDRFPEWFGRLPHDSDRVKVWNYMNDPKFIEHGLKLLGDKLVLWFAAASTKFNLPDPFRPPEAYEAKLSKAEWAAGYYLEQRHKLLSSDYLFTARDLDRLWILFYATGELACVEKLEHLAKNSSDNVIRAAASWSLDSHKKQLRLVGSVPADVMAEVRKLDKLEKIN